MWNFNIQCWIFGIILLCPTIPAKKPPLAQFFPDAVPLDKSRGDPGDPLYLTPYIKSGNIAEGQKLAKVEGLSQVVSYSGLLTVNASCNSNMFFWFFPAAYSPETAPVILWLQGGPGGSSMFGLFVEHGPFSVDKNMNLQFRPEAWSLTNSMLYIDNPVGTGFSFTQNDYCYANNQQDVARDLYEGLSQFFLLFPQHRERDFYVTGESYAGKYVPAISYKIHMENPTAKVRINLKGLAIGDGLCDPIHMLDYGNFLYEIGLADKHGRQLLHSKAAEAKDAIHRGDWHEATRLFDIVSSEYFEKTTGLSFYYNFLLQDEPVEFEYYAKFFSLPDVRKSIHTGSIVFGEEGKVYEHLYDDIMKSVKPWLEVLMDYYKVMIYSGQLDVIIPFPTTEAFLDTLKWSGQEKYKLEKRKIWYVEGEVAGYSKEVGNFTQLLVRNAGHILPYDQPKWAFDMINRFVSGKSFGAGQQSKKKPKTKKITHKLYKH
ncbi:probable serine carboxypeptidase CPVL isoform X2 [Artemia franciscana]